MITVLIPTFKRPELLRVALTSIVKQTFKHCITRVVVSENGLNDGSRTLCEEFPDLNIDYIYQETQLPHLQHWHWLMTQVKDGYTAFLCDDDWWNIYHIECAVKSLELNPDAVAYFSHFVYAPDEINIEFTEYPNVKFMNLFKDKINNYDLQVFDKTDVFSFSLLITPFHFSSVICKYDVFAKASQIFSRVHQTYADRVMWPVIASYGKVVFNPLSSTIVRFHPGQDSNNFSPEQWRQYNQEGSLLLLELADNIGVDIKSKLNEAYHHANIHGKVTLSEQFAEVFIDRQKIDWYKGKDDIIAIDKRFEERKEKEHNLALRNKSYKMVVARAVLNTIRKIAF